MNVAVHVITAGTTGSGKPSEVNTGTGGQAGAVIPGGELGALTNQPNSNSPGHGTARSGADRDCVAPS